MLKLKRSVQFSSVTDQLLYQVLTDHFPKTLQYITHLSLTQASVVLPKWNIQLDSATVQCHVFHFMLLHTNYNKIPRYCREDRAMPLLSIPIEFYKVEIGQKSGYLLSLIHI